MLVGLVGQLSVDRMFYFYFHQIIKYVQFKFCLLFESVRWDAEQITIHGMLAMVHISGMKHCGWYDQSIQPQSHITLADALSSSAHYLSE